jgi:hypothetical protein
MEVATSKQAPVHGNICYRAVVIPQVPCEAFVVQVTTFEEAEVVCDILARFEMFLFEHKVISDYSNAVFVEKWNWDDKEWEDVED